MIVARIMTGDIGVERPVGRRLTNCSGNVSEKKVITC